MSNKKSTNYYETMKVTFYRYHKGAYVQTEVVDKVESMTKSDLMKIADLRHPVLTKREFYNVLSTDRNGNLKKEFKIKNI